ncbi:acyl-CoA thioesterase [Thiotrichales bacterium 19S9-12]|nr:acyl-CoA thioesterase [Thiotrichales bacterium 19S9-11]MCF6812541.1 acyl-CoA thioesterase [Thiotrichales bacterium 19S9-12]
MPNFSIYKDKVRPFEVDFENIVHHANYLIWCENSRFNLFETIIGTPIEKFKSQQNTDIIILEANVKYLKSFKLGDHYYAKSRIEKVSNLKFKFIDYIYNNSNELCIKGEFISVGIDSTTKKPNRALISKLESYFSASFSDENYAVSA